MSVFSCDRARECLDEMLDGEIAPRDLAALKVHLDVCEACRDYRQLFVGLDELMREAPLPQADALESHRAAQGASAPPESGEEGTARRSARVAAIVLFALLIPAASTAAIVGLVRHLDSDPHTEEPSPPNGAHEPSVAETTSPPSAEDPTEPPPGADEDDSATADVVQAVDIPVRTEPEDVPPAADEESPANRSSPPTAAETAVLEGRLDEARDLALARVVEYPHDPATIDSLTLLAQAYRGARRYDDACDIYRQLIELYPASEAAQASHVALGQVELDALGRPQRSIEHFDAYLIQAPDGILAVDARIGRVRAQARMGETTHLIEAATDYLTVHPLGSAAPEVHQLRGDAHRSMGALAAACADYEVVLARWPESPYAHTARDGLEDCEEAP